MIQRKTNYEYGCKVRAVLIGGFSTTRGISTQSRVYYTAARGHHARIGCSTCRGDIIVEAKGSMISVNGDCMGVSKIIRKWGVQQLMTGN